MTISFTSSVRQRFQTFVVPSTQLEWGFDFTSVSVDSVNVRKTDRCCKWVTEAGDSISVSSRLHRCTFQIDRPERPVVSNTDTSLLLHTSDFPQSTTWYVHSGSSRRTTSILGLDRTNKYLTRHHIQLWDNVGQYSHTNNSCNTSLVP